MSAGQIAVLVAAIACCIAVVGLLVALGSLRREARRLAVVAEDFGARPFPWSPMPTGWWTRPPREMERVGAVLDSTESVHATVDSASKLAYRAFANPVVKVLAVRAGAATGLRRLKSGSDPARGNAHGSRNGNSRNGNGRR